MKIQNARRWAPAGMGGWIFAAVALLGASVIRESLHPFLGPSAPGTAFCITAALVEYYFGLAPALTVMIVGLGIADYLFVPPYGDFAEFDRRDVILLLTYPVITLFVIVLIERLRRAQYHTELIAAVAQSRYEMLLREDNERLLARRDADETDRLLRALTHRHDQLVFIQALEAPLVEHQKPLLASHTQPGSRFDNVHPEDIERVLTSLTPGTHSVRTVTCTGEYQRTDAVCERFTTPTGGFVILRLPNSSGGVPPTRPVDALADALNHWQSG